MAGAGITMASPLALSSAAAAQTGPRSLVCIFLHGGADSFNMLVPLNRRETGQDHDTYRRTRGEFALPANELLGIHNGDFGLNPALTGWADIASSGRLAAVANIGTLARPTTRNDFLNRANIPEDLFAHDAQQKQWKTGRPFVASDAGWGGAITSAIAGGTSVPPAFSINNSTAWLSSLDVGYARISATTRIERLVGYDFSQRAWIPSFEGMQSTMEAGLASAAASENPLDRAAAQSLRQSVITTEQLQAATADTPENDVGMDDVNSQELGGQLRQVARLIRNREALGMPRQVFFVEMGGWDTHGAQQERLPALLTELNNAVTSFQASMDAMGFADTVTSFTLSDFGRTLTNNGDGTDHAWGGNAFVWGGAVNDGQYGTFPNLSVNNNPDDTGDGRGNFGGRLIPTTSVSQYGATLARWMGLSEAQLDQAFPDLSNFSSRDLGFMG